MVVCSRKFTELLFFAQFSSFFFYIIKKHDLSRIHLHIFCISSGSVTEEKYILVKRLVISTVILFSLNNLRFVVALVQNDFI